MRHYIFSSKEEEQEYLKRYEIHNNNNNNLRSYYSPSSTNTLMDMTRTSSFASSSSSHSNHEDDLDKHHPLQEFMLSVTIPERSIHSFSASSSPSSSSLVLPNNQNNQNRNGTDANQPTVYHGLAISGQDLFINPHFLDQNEDHDDEVSRSLLLPIDTTMATTTATNRMANTVQPADFPSLLTPIDGEFIIPPRLTINHHHEENSDDLTMAPSNNVNVTHGGRRGRRIAGGRRSISQHDEDTHSDIVVPFFASPQPMEQVVDNNQMIRTEGSLETMHYDININVTEDDDDFDFHFNRLEFENMIPPPVPPNTAVVMDTPYITSAEPKAYTPLFTRFTDTLSTIPRTINHNSSMASTFATCFREKLEELYRDGLDENGNPKPFSSHLEQAQQYHYHHQYLEHHQPSPNPAAVVAAAYISHDTTSQPQQTNLSSSSPSHSLSRHHRTTNYLDNNGNPCTNHAVTSLGPRTSFCADASNHVPFDIRSVLDEQTHCKKYFQSKKLFDLDIELMQMDIHCLEELVDSLERIAPVGR